MPPINTPDNRVLVRDFLIFQLKTWLDGFKDAVMIPLSIIALVLDLLSGGVRRGRIFYALLGVAERFDRWLNLYSVSQAAGQNRDGLFGASRAGDATLVGELEQMMRGPEPPAMPAGVRRTG